MYIFEICCVLGCLYSFLGKYLFHMFHVLCINRMCNLKKKDQQMHSDI